MRTAERAAAQHLFMQRSRRLIMVATNAFGMGIDKPNIRYILHYHAPGALEQYVQEIGRAGRDGRPAHCIFLYDPADLEIQERLQVLNRPTPAGTWSASSARSALGPPSSAPRQPPRSPILLACYCEFARLCCRISSRLASSSATGKAVLSSYRSRISLLAPTTC
jgi:hypothetical protein